MSKFNDFVRDMDRSIDERVEGLRTNLAYSPPEVWDERFQQLKAELKTHLRHNLTTHDFPLPKAPAPSMCRNLWGPPGNRSLTCTKPSGHEPPCGYQNACCARYRKPGRARDSVCMRDPGHEGDHE